MRLDELGAPGTDYALQVHDYERPSRVRLVGIETIPRETDGLRPVRNERRARMLIVEGHVGAKAAGTVIRARGRSILMEWAEFELRQTERTEARVRREEEGHVARERAFDIRRRMAAVGLGVGPEPAADDYDAPLQRGRGRWERTHMLVEDELLEALLGKAEAAA